MNAKHLFKGMLIVAAGLSLTCPEGQCQTDSTVRIMYWDLTGPGGVSQERENAVAQVIDSIQPDVLVAQFLPNLADTAKLVHQLNEIHKGNGQFVLYSHFNSLLIAINRAAVRATIIHKAVDEYNNQSGVSLSFTDGQCLGVLVGNWRREFGETLTSHYEGGSGILGMAAAVELEPDCAGRVLVLGTLNARESSDPGLQQVSYDGFLASRIVDLARAEGVWDSTEAFASLHTSSTVDGLVRRSVMVMASLSLLDYISSWFIVGNDGQHYGQSVSEGGNESVSGEIAEALEIVSAHLPIVVDVSLKRISSVEEESEILDLDLD